MATAESTVKEPKNITRARLRGILSEPKTNAFFETLTDADLEEFIKMWMMAMRGRNTAEKKDIASLMPTSIKEGIKKKFGLDIDTDRTRISVAEEMFSRMMKYLAQHPERLTMGIYDELIEHKMFHWVVSLVDKKKDEKGNVYLTPTKTALTQGNAITAERIINLQSKGIAKVEMLFDLITKKKGEQSNLGSISKSLRDILAALHMMKLDFSQDEAMERTFKQTETTPDGTTVKESMVRYVKKSSEMWSSKT